MTKRSEGKNIMQSIYRFANQSNRTAPKPAPRASTCIIPMADAAEERAWDDEMRRRGLPIAA